MVTTKTMVDSGAIFDLPIESVLPNPHNLRQTWNDEDQDELASSIRVHGILEPLIATSNGADGQVVLVAGHRRLDAAKRAGLLTVPVIVRDIQDPKAQLQLMVVENCQRSDLQPMELAEAFERLHRDFGLTNEQIGKAVGKNQATIVAYKSLLRLPLDVQAMVRSGDIPYYHGVLLVRANDPSKIRILAQRVAEGMTQKQLETAIRELKSPRPRQLGQHKSQPKRRSAATVSDFLRRASNLNGTVTWREVVKSFTHACETCGWTEEPDDELCRDCPAFSLLKYADVFRSEI